MMPLWMFILFLSFIGILGSLIFIRSSMYPEKPLQKGDIYIRVAVFLMSLFLTLVTASGVYVGIPERISGTNDFIYTLAFNEYWAVIPFSIAVVSLFAIIYAWLSVFGRKKEGDL